MRSYTTALHRLNTWATRGPSLPAPPRPCPPRHPLAARSAAAPPSPSPQEAPAGTRPWAPRSGRCRASTWTWWARAAP
eukprot:7387579-Prymnesium_polylepis.2